MAPRPAVKSQLRALQCAGEHNRIARCKHQARKCCGPAGGGGASALLARPTLEVLTPLLHIRLDLCHCVTPQAGAPALALKPAGLGQSLPGAVGGARRREGRPGAPHGAHFLHSCCPVWAVRGERGAGACTLGVQRPTPSAAETSSVCTAVYNGQLPECLRSDATRDSPSCLLRVAQHAAIIFPQDLRCFLDP